ncbi:beta-lactamase domain-containing protein [Pochonia chlamydosporia 170]|uniref:Beta-lactamase domain-containing protein n=1 Tax=Pochonia chlamydosporia 170 TaxID=1380566 RepID=A0A179EXB2_METCM|nr:beta-lactamase domain-containing protein [Pochonia chlamydosporia 170]OAQ57808.1 beta-lactamase domain-containing protein [Pochonia chlamydosporia 170]
MDLFHSPKFVSHVESLLDKFHCPGASIAIVQNHTIASAGYGLVHLHPPELMTPDTLFDVASASKSLTAASVALLVGDDQKYLNVTYETTMSSLLPDDFVMSEASYTEQVTIEDVLSHRTGVAPSDGGGLQAGCCVGINWDVKEMEANKEEIVEKKLLKMQWVTAKLGEEGHPFQT